MKKEYISPALKIKAIEAGDLLLTSGNGVTSQGDGIGSGGIDESGEKDPAAKPFSVWNDGEDE